ncbi:DUF982 domain-containing protein [Bosea sp. BH3]|uniref:DUF982 domain-containing protein n=1 Tax=Bosea sp. BH3 TaxID=2871701 RepID=UPI0021CB7937|nr:DUF982 domain-containing protein [Bosea sp. BH3]MCU4178216.1 DUF982 domain-containing protein [Bosea sp. BH3]
MPLHWFTPPVYVETERPGERYAVTNIERAAEFLLLWRKHCPGDEWHRAVQACMAAIKGQGSVDEARETFGTAARACGRSVTEPV